MSAFANCGRAVAHVRGSYGPQPAMPLFHRQRYHQTRAAGISRPTTSIPSTSANWKPPQIANLHRQSGPKLLHRRAGCEKATLNTTTEFLNREAVFMTSPLKTIARLM